MEVSHAQEERLLRDAHQRAHGRRPFPHVCLSTRNVCSDVSEDRLRHAVDVLVARERVLRSSFGRTGSSFVAEFAPYGASDVVVDLGRASRSELEFHVCRAVDRLVDEPDTPRIAFVLARDEADQLSLTVVGDHLILDARSLDVIFERLSQIIKNDEVATPLDFYDYAHEQRLEWSRVGVEVVQSWRETWGSAFLSPLNEAVLKPGRVFSSQALGEDSSAFERSALSAGVTPGEAWLSAGLVAARPYLDERASGFLFASSGRPPGFRDSIGWFSNMHPVRLSPQIAEDRGVGFLRAVSASIRQCVRSTTIPLAALTRDLDPERYGTFPNTALLVMSVDGSALRPNADRSAGIFGEVVDLDVASLGGFNGVSIWFDFVGSASTVTSAAPEHVDFAGAAMGGRVQQAMGELLSELTAAAR